MDKYLHPTQNNGLYYLSTSLSKLIPVNEIDSGLFVIKYTFNIMGKQYDKSLNAKSVIRVFNILL